ncbi:MAG: sulfite oxidase-like oxidoreductase [Candidatus Bathyarchaeia archaeon]
MTEDDLLRRAPPGQVISSSWPVLTYGSTPAVALESWSLEVRGLVDRRLKLAWEDIFKLQKTVVVADFHCVTGWTKPRNTWEGVTFRTLMKEASPRPEAAFASFECYGGYTTSLPLAALIDDEVLLAYSHNGAPLPAEHGGPLRLIVPKRYAYKSAKWLHVIELLKHDRLGFWELRGYSNTADPWSEDRYSF